jgi:hypothetical protein
MWSTTCLIASRTTTELGGSADVSQGFLRKGSDVPILELVPNRNSAEGFVIITFVFFGTRSVKLHIHNHTGEIDQDNNGVAPGVNTILIIFLAAMVVRAREDRTFVCSMQMLTDWSRTMFLNVVFTSNIIKVMFSDSINCLLVRYSYLS